MTTDHLAFAFVTIPIPYQYESADRLSGPYSVWHDILSVSCGCAEGAPFSGRSPGKRVALVLVSPGHLLALLGTAVLTVPAAAQVAVQTIEDCTDACMLRVQRIAVIGDSVGPGYVGDPAALSQSSDGRWILADRFDQDRLKVFSEEGVFRRTVGRRGGGPGEFQVTQFITPIGGDSIEVFDLGQARFTVFDASWNVVRTSQVRQAGPEMARFADGSRVFSGKINLPMQLGLPLHLLSPAGEHLRSFGADPIIGQVSNRDLFYRQLAVSGPDRLWAAHLVRYRLEEWNTAGELLSILERAPEWFPPQSTFDATPSSGGPPTPGLFGVRYDSTGLIWTIIAVPDAGWAEGVDQGQDPWGRMVPVPGDFGALFDTIVEVIDPRTATVVGRARLDAYLKDFAADGIAYGLGEHPNGETRIEIWRIQLPSAPASGFTNRR